jgi:hypothetical protein
VVRGRTLVAGTVIAAATLVAGCDSHAPVPPVGKSPYARASARPYVPPKLPVDCEAVAAHIQPGVVRDLGLINNASPAPEDRHQLVCSARGTSPDGTMQIYLLWGVQVMPPDPVDPAGRGLPQWQRDTAVRIINAFCEGKTEPVAGARYTVRCTKSADDGAGTGLGAAGDDGMVAGVEATVSGAAPGAQDTARQFADAAARAVVDAGLAAR